MIKKANREKWRQQKDNAYNIAAIKTQQKAASTAADAAIVASRIKLKLLQRLEREVDSLPELVGSESRQSVIQNKFGENGKGRVPSETKEMTKSYNLRDLTTAYKNLTADMPKQQDTSTLEKLDELLEVAWNAAHTETS